METAVLLTARLKQEQNNYIGYQPELIPLLGGSGSIIKIHCNVLGNPGDSTSICMSNQKLAEPGQGAPEIPSSICMPCESAICDTCAILVFVIQQRMSANDGLDNDCDGLD